MISLTQKLLPDNTQHSQRTNTHAPPGFEPAIPASERPQTQALGRLHTHRLCRSRIRLRSWSFSHVPALPPPAVGFIRTEVFQTVVQRRQVQIRVQDARSTLKLINRTKKMFVRRPACRVPVRHANLPGRQLGRTGCV